MRAIIPYARIFFPSLPLFHPVQIHFVQGGHSTFPEPFISAVISLPRFCNADGNARKQLSSADDLENDDRLRSIAHCGQRERERERERFYRSKLPRRASSKSSRSLGNDL